MAVHILQENQVRIVPLPAKTESYTPIPHGQMIDVIRECMRNNNLPITSTKFVSSNSGNKMIGEFRFDQDDNELGGSVIFRNSYDKSVAAAITIGSIVLVCSNGMIRGLQEAFLKRKHTGHADEEVYNYTQNAINHYAELHQSMRRDAELMKRVYIDKHIAASLIGEMFINDEVLTATQLGIVKKEIDFSEHFKLVEGVGSMWNLYNWCTQSFKKSHPVDYLENHINLHKFAMENTYERLQAIDEMM